MQIVEHHFSVGKQTPTREQLQAPRYHTRNDIFFGPNPNFELRLRSGLMDSWSSTLLSRITYRRSILLNDSLPIMKCYEMDSFSLFSTESELSYDFCQKWILWRHRKKYPKIRFHVFAHKMSISTWIVVEIHQVYSSNFSSLEWMNYYCISHLNCGKSLYCIPNHSFRWKTRTEQNSLMSRRMLLFPFLVVVIQITFCLVTASVANIFVCLVLGSF